LEWNVIDTIIFDAEGVVVDTECIWDKGQEEFLKRRGFVYDRAQVKPLLTGRSLVEGVRAMQQFYGFGGDPAELARERFEIVKDHMAEGVKFIDGFQTFFERVRATYKTCIASAMSEELMAIVDRVLGLSALFGGDKIFTLVHVNYVSKPDPALFVHAARQLQSAPEQCLVIEDAPFGVEAAHRAHMKCIGLATTYEPDQLAAADLVARSYDDDIDLFLLRERTNRSFIVQIINRTSRPLVRMHFDASYGSYLPAREPPDQIAAGGTAKIAMESPYPTGVQGSATYAPPDLPQEKFVFQFAVHLVRPNSLDCQCPTGFHVDASGGRGSKAEGVYTVTSD